MATLPIRAASTALLLGVSAAACGDTSAAPDIDAGPDDDGEIWDEVYDGPEDFERDECEGDVGEVAAPEIWHLGADTQKEGHFGPFRPIWFRPEGDVIEWSGEEGELGARVAGLAWDESSRREDDLFLRHHHYRDFHNLVWALTACGEDDGYLTGRYADCYFVTLTHPPEARCRETRFRAARVEPLGDPPASELTERARYAAPESGRESEHAAVRVRDELAYLWRADEGLRVIDVSDPAEPEQIGHLAARVDEDDEAEPRFRRVDVEIIESEGGALYAALASSEGGLIADVSDPEAPEEVGALGRVHALHGEGDRLYGVRGLGHGSPRLVIHDVSEPSSPETIGTYTEPDTTTWSLTLEPQSQPPPVASDAVYDVDADGDRVYISHGRAGVIVVDAQDPENPERVTALRDDHSYSRATARAHVEGRALILVSEQRFDGGLRVLEGDPGSSDFLAPLGDYDTRAEVAPGAIRVSGERAYVAYHQDGLRVVDLGDPEAPEEIGHYHTWPGPDADYGARFAEAAIDVDVDPDRDLVFVADTHLGLVILEHE